MVPRQFKFSGALAKRLNGHAPVHIAAQYGLANVVMLLIEKGEDINAKGYNDATPALLAAAQGHHDVLKALVEKGANIFITNTNGVTPIQAYAASGPMKTEVIEILLQNEPDMLIGSCPQQSESNPKCCCTT